LDVFAGRQARAEEDRVLILGAGDAGEMALRWILMNPQLDYRPVGFLDQDPFMDGRQIHGVEVLGGFEQLESILEGKEIDGVILTSGVRDDGKILQEVLSVCQERGCWVRSLRLEFELIR
jgi:FlaA1/EpsC-like NDP-sugar epimerase